MLRVNGWVLDYRQGSWNVSEVTNRTNQITGEVTEVPIVRYTYISLEGAVKRFAEITASKDNFETYLKEYEKISSKVLEEARKLDDILSVKLKRLKKNDGSDD